MVIEKRFKKTAWVFLNVITLTAHAAVNVLCPIFDENCISQPAAQDFSNQYHYSESDLVKLSPPSTEDKEVPILLSSSANSFINSIFNIAVLNNGIYLGAQANYSTRLNVTDYLFMQNPRLQGVGGDIEVMNIPVNLVNNNDPGGRIYVGYNFNDHFALEERYTRFTLGNIHEMTDIQYNNYMHIPTNNVYEVIARQSISLTPALSLLTKEGEALISTDIRETDGVLVSNGASDHHDMIRPIVGLGTGYSISKNLIADLYYSYLLETQAIHAQMLTAGLTYFVA